MVKLSIEEKIQRYDEAIERAESIYNETAIPSATTKGICTYIFPELKESEGERIRKEIIRFIQMDVEDETVGNKWIAWLKKQKEFVSADFDDVWETADCEELTAPLDKYSKDAIKKMCHAWYDKGIELERRNWLEKQGEQKTACDEEDDKMIKNLTSELYNLETRKLIDKETKDKYTIWLKSLKDRVQPKSQWKPSDEQMKQLGWIANQNKDNMIGKELMTLYNDLKKLKEY